MASARSVLLDGTILLLEGLLRLVNGALRAAMLPGEAVWALRQVATGAAAGGQRKRVVIVGASFAGLWCQRNLCKDYDVTVVDYKKYFEYTPGVLRLFVEITGPIPASHNKFICGEAVGINSSSSKLLVRVESGSVVLTPKDVPYDYLLIGTGSDYAGSIKASKKDSNLLQRTDTWRFEFQRLLEARSVLIIGGGPVGVELAGEILTAYPTKKVTITDRQNELCSSFQPSTRSYVTDWLKQRNCELVLGSPISGIFPDLKIDEKGCTLQSGRRLEADIVYKCMGFKPCTEWARKSLGGAMDSRGFIRVNNHLQVVGHSNIMAMGDCMTHTSNELKLGHTAEVNAHLVVDNLKRLESKLPLLPYPKGVVGCSKTPKIYCVSLGKYDASLGFNWLVINGALAAVMKWLLEWTKVMACREVPVGILFWKVADKISNFIARTLIKTDRGKVS